MFVSEDRLLPAVDAALAGHGLAGGPGGDVELISCNNERPMLFCPAANPENFVPGSSDESRLKYYYNVHVSYYTAGSGLQR